MKILLSPAKTQNFFNHSDHNTGKVSIFNLKTEQLSKACKELSIQELRRIMKISLKLARLTYDRFQIWNPDFDVSTRDISEEIPFKPAIFTFNGDVYEAFSNTTYSKSDIAFMEKQIRIISGFYGLLTPLTYIKPYRLEMGTRLSFTVNSKKYKNLYEYWKGPLTLSLKKELKSDEIILNLASSEYSKAIDLESFGNSVVKVYFKVIRNKIPKIIGIYAKRQRGEMANWIIKNRIVNIPDLKKYQNDGFSFSASLSFKNKLVFTKEH